jgi:hypothetical protein
MADEENDALLIGKVAIAYNEAMAMIFVFFWLASGAERDVAASVFESMPSDHARRELAKIAVETGFKSLGVEVDGIDGDGGTLRKKIAAALGELSRLARGRNKAVHDRWYRPEGKVKDGEQRAVFEKLFSDLIDVNKQLASFNYGLQVSASLSDPKRFI